MDVAIVGGGLAGLVAARRLAAGGHAVTVYEARESVGGRVHTVREDGFTMDAGFQVYFTAYPAGRRELDHGGLDLRTFTPGATIARPGRRSILSDPVRDPGSLVETLFNREVRAADKLRILRLRRDLGRRSFDDLLAGSDTTVEAYLAERGFSRAFVDRFARPFYGGITLSRSLGTSSHVFEYTFKALSEGAIAVPAEGMAAIPRQLAGRARSAGARIETGRPVTDLRTDAGGVVATVGGETVEADAAVVATDPRTAGRLTGVDAPTGRLGCVTLHAAIDGHDALDTGGRILLNAADGRPNTVAQLSAVAPEYAPDGKELLAATFLGDDGDDGGGGDARADGDAHAGDPVDERVRPESDAELADHTLSALRDWYPEHRFDGFEPLRVDRVPFAQFPQPPGFREKLPGVDRPDGPVVLAGDYTAWSSIQGALASGRRAAETLSTGGPA